MSTDSLPYALQESLLAALCLDNSEASARLTEILAADHFDTGAMRVIAERALKYRKEFGRPIGRNHIDDVFADFLEARNERVVKTYTQVLHGLLGVSDQLNAEYLLTRVPEFICRQTLKGTVLKAAERLQQAGAGHVDQVTEILEKGLIASNAIKANQGTDIGPVIVTMSDMQMQPIVWAWFKVIPYGKLTLIGGDPKLGKSTVGLSFVATLTTAGIWPDETRCDDPCSALIMSTEDDPQDTILPRLVAMGADTKRCHYLEMVKTVDGEERDFDLGRDLPKLQRYLEDHREVRVILIEPVVAYVNPKDGSSEPEIRRKLRPLAKLAQRYQLAIIGIMHFRKSGDAATPIHMIAGSLAYGAVARVAYAVVKDKNDPDRRLFLTMGNNLAKGDLGFAYRIEEVRVDRQIAATAIAWEGAVEITAEEALASDPKAEVKKIDAAEAWLRTRLMPGPVPATQIEDEVEATRWWSWKTVERAADRMGVTKQKDGFQGLSMWAYKPGG